MLRSGQMRAAARTTLLALCGCAAACAPAGVGSGDAGAPLRLPLEPIDRFAGELHLHQFPAGGHAWAAFVAEAVPVARVHGDQLYSLDTAVTATEGACQLWRRPICQPACTDGTFCIGPDTCTPLNPMKYIDGGAVHVTGSRIKDPIELWFVSGDSSYAADPPPGAARLFAGDELLRIEGGQGPTRLSGVIPAPAPVQLLEPAPEGPLHLPSGDALHVRWDPGSAALVVAAISVSTASGDWGNIRCVGPDSGRMTVPPSLMAGLPPPPRSNRFELERDNEVLLKTVTPGLGMLAHAAYSAWINGEDR